MQRLIWAAALALLGCALWLWGFGGADQVATWAADGQRSAQNAMARGLRALKGGAPGALAALLAICFAYGFFHAAGPGHGKMIVGGYAMARRVPLLRVSLLALAASLAQAASAVVLVYGALWVLNWGRAQMQGAAEQVFAPLSYAMMAAVGVWLAIRGARRLFRARLSAQTPKHDHDHAHTHAHGATCSSCGHAHGPTLEQAADVRSLRDAVAVVASVAARPCTGTIFVLILTWQMDIVLAGLLGAVAIALGTATVTIAVGLAAATLREGALSRFEGVGAVRAMAVIELATGLGVAVLASQIALRLLG